jgi:hypothetical protein
MRVCSWQIFRYWHLRQCRAAIELVSGSGTTENFRRVLACQNGPIPAWLGDGRGISGYARLAMLSDPASMSPSLNACNSIGGTIKVENPQSRHIHAVG